ncbi:cyclic-phosphate processing receiver domain-containing protein [Chryseobacterium sp. Leaf394]|uniref:cyclic-phosphate processing receiver domain-containing protein n=1 Tax=Chryseobacterium sp. Leaf394 TaxID=1736361 RepID=UPI000AA253D6
MTKRLLFLDDLRYPIDAYHYTKQDIFLRDDWVIARNYHQFVSSILEEGLPEFISFDHDLADEDYLESDSHEIPEKTGYECAKWLINYCMDHNAELPKFFSHSMNPVGKENIESLLNNYKKLTR